MRRTAALLLVLACAHADPAAYVSSGRYQAEVLEVASQAQAWLEQRLARGGDRLAMVVDIDETALSNLPVLRADGYKLVREHLRESFARAEAAPMQPVLDLVRFARGRGVGIFFITGRQEKFRAATEQNLRAAGYQFEQVILRPDDFQTKSAADFKAPERRKLEVQGWTIVA